MKLNEHSLMLSSSNMKHCCCPVIVDRQRCAAFCSVEELENRTTQRAVSALRINRPLRPMVLEVFFVVLPRLSLPAQIYPLFGKCIYKNRVMFLRDTFYFHWPNKHFTLNLKSVFLALNLEDSAYVITKKSMEPMNSSLSATLVFPSWWTLQTVHEMK